MLKSLINLFFCSLPLICAILPAKTSAETGAEIWQQLSTSQEISESQKINLYARNRFRGNFREWWYAEAGAALPYTLGSKFTLTPTLSFLRIQPGPVVNSEYRPGLNMEWKEDLSSFTFSTRLRHELRIVEPDELGDENTTYRARIRVKLDYPVADQTKVFISQEGLYGSGSSTWEQSRFFLGVSLPRYRDIGSSLAWGIFSRRRAGASSYADAHVLSLALNW